MSQSAQPAWLVGEYAPVADEIEAFELPAGFHGSWIADPA